MPDKPVHLGSRLRYPITITKLLKSPGDTLKKQDIILEYKFTWRRQINEEEWSDETTYTEFDSPADGILREWLLEEGAVVNANVPCMTVEESCSHESQFNGLCTSCGADLTEINWASEERDTDRAKINMTHDQLGLTVSESVATKAEHDTQKRLLRQRKLSLVVDLDQTIIHACVDPSVGEWMSDPSNPNHEAVKDVRHFQLTDNGPHNGIASACTYYVKFRPGLQEFLEEVGAMYELHVYTMGTRAYAQNIARLVDPDRKLFGSRIISRDENGSLEAKNLQRLFPVSTDMVVIIDDRADVWPMNRPNLIKVVPYDFFKGIGDINSSFLPPRTDIVPPSPTTNGTTTPETAPAAVESSTTDEVSPETKAKASPLKDIARMSGADDETNMKAQAEEQEKTLEKQLHDRPLQHAQEELEKKDETQETETGEVPTGHHRSHLLNDDDEELIALQDHLTDIHQAFYDTYDKRRKERKQGEPKHNPGEKKPRRPSMDEPVDLSLVPDVGDILEDLKSSVLEGLVIVLSGLVPLNTAVDKSDIGMLAQSFGAQVLDSVSDRVTHLVVSAQRPRTQKVQKAAKIPSIRIVKENWLWDCLSQWRRLHESPYFLDIANADRGQPGENVEEPSEDDELAVKELDNFNLDQLDEDDKILKEMLEMDSDEDFGTDDDSAAEESGTEAEGDETDGESRKKGVKRKVLADDGDGESDGESALAKKQRIARNRGASGLRSAVTQNGDEEGEDEGSSLPTPGPTTGDESQPLDEDADFEDELERDLLAELEAADDD